MEDAGTSEEDDDFESQDSNTPIDHGHLARNCSIKVYEKMEITGREVQAIGWMMFKHLRDELLQKMC